MNTKNYHINKFINAIFLNVEERYFIYNLNSFIFAEINKDLYSLLSEWDGEFNEKFLQKAQIENKDRNIQEVIQNLKLCEEKPAEGTLINLEKCKPGSLWLLVTDNCNLRCSYCYHNEEQKSKFYSDMEFYVAKKSIDLFFEMCVRENVTITFFGGEPLLNFDLIKKVVDYIEEKNIEMARKIHFSIATNAILVTKEIAEYMKNKNFFVTVSIDGDEIRHNKTRRNLNGGDSFKSVKRGVDILRNNIEYLGARITVTKENLNNLDECVNELFNMGFDSISYKLAGACQKYLTVGREEHDVLEDQIERLSNIFVSKLFAGDIKIIDRVLYWIKKINKKPIIGECLFAVNGKLVVDPKGNFYGCQETVGNDEFIIGNVNNGVIYEKLKKCTPPLLVERDGCTSCWLKKMCDGTCYYASYSKYGNYDKPIVESCLEIKKSFIESLFVYACLYIKNPEYLNIILQSRYTDLHKIKEWAAKNVI